jgi:UDP-N-acetylmuramyl pentapeptide phosphotransferase/UDP-N-acetylglucosamine-1-phosphate transferase
MLQLLNQINLNFSSFKFSILAFVTAFIVAMLFMLPLIKIINRFHLFDVPDNRKEHSTPIPTMGGIAIFASLIIACMLWYRFTNDILTISFFFSICTLFAVGIMDDLRNMPARYKLVIQAAVASLIAFSGVRIESFNGLFGIEQLPLAAQYTITIITITGITNAFNLIDGIDGLAGGIGFMSLIIQGIILTLCNDGNNAIIAFALGGGLLGFLYYNFNPARIFMGDTGSLVLGFVVAVLCVQIIRLNSGLFTGSIIVNAPVFALGIVAIPVYDTLRVFAIRIWQGRSPFSPDKNHIHHLLTNNGWSHSFTSRTICLLHGFLLATGYFLKNIPQLPAVGIMVGILLIATFIFQRLKPGSFTAIHPAKESMAS